MLIKNNKLVPQTTLLCLIDRCLSRSYIFSLLVGLRTLMCTSRNMNEIIVIILTTMLVIQSLCSWFKKHSLTDRWQALTIGTEQLFQVHGFKSFVYWIRKKEIINHMQVLLLNYFDDIKKTLKSIISLQSQRGIWHIDLVRIFSFPLINL